MFIIAVLAMSLAQTVALRAEDKYKFVEASDLTLTGKIFEDTPNPYHRLDTVRYKGFTKTENLQVRMSSGIACAFRTDSRVITVLTEYAVPGYPNNTNGISARGYDLYVRRDGKWIYAASQVNKAGRLGDNLVLLSGLDGKSHDFLMYLPLYSEEHSIRIGVESGAVITALGNPFRHRIAVWGSSYTHGSSTSRAGMTWPAQFSRATGIQLLSLGCSGRCKLQDYFCTALCDVKADAFIFDTFSNPTAEMIRERLIPFIERMVAAHPGKPLIFQQTIRREGRNFNLELDAEESLKQAVADSIMRFAVKRYPDVYFIHPDARDKSHNATVDGTHPDNYGYTLWSESIRKPVLRILKKYGIR